MLLAIASALGLCTASACAPPAAPAAARAPAPAKTGAASGKPLTAAAIRALLFDLHRSIDQLSRKGHSPAYRATAKLAPAGTCYGGPAKPFMKVADVLPALQARLSGKALPCFVATHFGCRVGDWLAEAGVAAQGVAYATYDKSKVTLVEQAPDRVVADVVESEGGDLSDGKIDYDRVGDGQENLVTSRYELTRGPDGKWRVTDRQVSFKEWECRPN